jgi:hypothetical protein
VPSTFNYSIHHDENTGRQNNAIFSFNYLEARFSVGDREGTNGLPFVSLNDPRLPTFDAGSDSMARPNCFSPRSTRIAVHRRLALGVEARLIQAEAALRNNDLVTFRSMLNDARANSLTYTADGDPNGELLPSRADRGQRHSDDGGWAESPVSGARARLVPHVASSGRHAPSGLAVWTERGRCLPHWPVRAGQHVEGWHQLWDGREPADSERGEEQQAILAERRGVHQPLGGDYLSLS